MARIKAKIFEYTPIGVNGDAFTSNISSHVSGDLLIAIVNRHNDNNNNLNCSDPTWTNLVLPVNQSPNNIMRIFYKVATSSSEPPVEFTSTRNEEWGVDMLTIENHNGIDSVNSIAVSAGRSFSTPALNTTSDGCLIIKGFTSEERCLFLPTSEDYFTKKPHTFPNNRCGSGYGWSYKETMGPVTQTSFRQIRENRNCDAVVFTLAIKTSDPNDTVHRVCEFNATLLDPGTMTSDSFTGNSWGNPGIDVNGINVDYGGGDLDPLEDEGIMCASRALRYDVLTGNLNNQYHGPKLSLGTPTDFTSDKLLFHYKMETPEDNVKLDTIQNNGKVVVFHQGANWIAYTYGGKYDLSLYKSEWIPVLVDPNNTSLAIDSNGTVDFSSIDGISFLVLDINSEPFGILYNMIYKNGTIGLSSGSTSDPITMDRYRWGYKSYGMATVIRNLRANQYLSYSKIIIGCGEKTYMDFSDSSIQFPTSYVTGFKQDFDGDFNDIGLVLDLGLDSTSLMADTHLLSTSNPFSFNVIDNGFISVMDWYGLVVTGAKSPTLAPIGVFNDVTFNKHDGPVDARGCTLSLFTVDRALNQGLIIDTNTSTIDVVITNNPVGIVINDAGNYIINAITFTNNTIGVQVTADLPLVTDEVNITPGALAITFQDDHTGPGSVNILNDAVLTVSNLPANANATFGYWPVAGTREIDIVYFTVANNTDTFINVNLEQGQYYWVADAMEYERTPNGIITVTGDMTLMVHLQKILSTDGADFIPNSLDPNQQMIADKFEWNLSNPLQPYIEVSHAAGGTWRLSGDDFGALAFKIDQLQSQSFALAFYNTLFLQPKEVIWGATNTLVLRQNPSNPAGTIIDLREITIRRSGTDLDDFVDHGTDNCFPVLINTTSPFVINSVGSGGGGGNCPTVTEIKDELLLVKDQFQADLTGIATKQDVNNAAL